MQEVDVAVGARQHNFLLLALDGVLSWRCSDLCE